MIRVQPNYILAFEIVGQKVNHKLRRSKLPPLSHQSNRATVHHRMSPEDVGPDCLLRLSWRRWRTVSWVLVLGNPFALKPEIAKSMTDQQEQ